MAAEFFYIFFQMFFVFRAVITEEFKVPDKMVGFSKYPLLCFPPFPVLSVACTLCVSVPWGRTAALQGLRALWASLQAEALRALSRCSVRPPVPVLHAWSRWPRRGQPALPRSESRDCLLNSGSRVCLNVDWGHVLILFICFSYWQGR